MVKTVVRYTFWHWFGLISAFMLLIALSILVFRYVQGNKEIRLVAKIEVYKVNPIPNLGFEIDEEQKQDLIENIRQQIPLKDASTEQGKKIFNAVFNSHIKTYIDYVRKFHSYYEIELNNKSEQMLTDVSVSMKGNGCYLYDDNLGEMVFSDFKNSILIPDLPPKTKISLLVWSETILSDYTVFPSKTVSISCKEGNTQIIYPVKVTGISAWNSIHNNYPLVFVFSGVLILFVVLIVIFFNMGCRQNSLSAEKDS